MARNWGYLADLAALYSTNALELPVSWPEVSQEYLSAPNASDICSSFGISVLVQWFSNVRVHQNFLRDLLRPKLLDPILRVSNSIGLTGNWSFCVSTNCPSDAMLLAQGYTLKTILLFQSPHSVQFSCSVVSHSLRFHELQHARPPCPSPTPRVHSDSHPLSR